MSARTRETIGVEGGSPMQQNRCGYAHRPEAWCNTCQYLTKSHCGYYLSMASWDIIQTWIPLAIAVGYVDMTGGPR